MRIQKSLDRSPVRRAGFTLIELLVVISIIALLISVLLPSMSSARRTGQRVACSAGLRRLAEGMGQYAQDNEDAIIGSPVTSGAYLCEKDSEGGCSWVARAYGPAVQSWDFMGPMAKLWGMGLKIPSKASDDKGVIEYFNTLRSHPAFLCPSNSFLAMKFDGPDAGAGFVISYNTQRYQLTPGSGWWSDHGEKPPPNWQPIVGRMGSPAEKIFCGDGARYITEDSHILDYDLSVRGSYGGAFSDTGTYSTYSRSWDRCWAPGNTKTGPSDARYYAFRHATSEPPQGARANVLKANFAFYDGHVETLGDLESSNVHSWLPAGSRMTNVGGNVWPDTAARFGYTDDFNIGQ